MESLTRFYLERMVSDVCSLEVARKGAYDIESEASGEFERGGRLYSGRLDRVDSVGGRPRVVIDYKTSSSIHKQGSTIRDHMLGLKPDGKPRYWQVPMYAYAARREGRYPEALELATPLAVWLRAVSSSIALEASAIQMSPLSG